MSVSMLSPIMTQFSDSPQCLSRCLWTYSKAFLVGLPKWVIFSSLLQISLQMASRAILKGLRRSLGRGWSFLRNHRSLSAEQMGMWVLCATYSLPWHTRPSSVERMSRTTWMHSSHRTGLLSVNTRSNLIWCRSSVSTPRRLLTFSETAAMTSGGLLEKGTVWGKIVQYSSIVMQQGISSKGRISSIYWRPMNSTSLSCQQWNVFLMGVQFRITWSRPMGVARPSSSVICSALICSVLAVLFVKNTNGMLFFWSSSMPSVAPSSFCFCWTITPSISTTTASLFFLASIVKDLKFAVKPPRIGCPTDSNGLNLLIAVLSLQSAMDDDDGRRPKMKKEKSKKSNVEPALLLAQNTNVFSQLSANYLQTKANISEEEKAFIQNTEIIEYHDPNISRMIGLLRKKAEVTKLKAIGELKEYVRTMGADQVEAFMSTFSYLFRQIMLSEDSRQIIDEMCSILAFFLESHKKLVVPNIAVIYTPLLIAQKVTTHKFFPLLFGGDPAAHPQKSIILLLKTEVAKQFMIVSRIVIDNDDVGKLAQPVFLRNCYGLLKAFKELVLSYGGLGAEQQAKLAPPWAELYAKFVQLSDSAGARKYLKEDSKAKAAFLEAFVTYLAVETTKRIPTDIDPVYLANQVVENYLTKDIAVQTSLWRHCNTQIIPILVKLNIRSKYEISLMDALKVGGAAMLKELPNYVRVFPLTSFANKNVNQISNTINYIRKLNDAILDLDEENELRLQCYGDLNVYFIEQYRQLRANFPSDTPDEKENKRRDQMRRLTEKAERQAAQSLEERYYKHPPASRNSVSFYIPAQFDKIIRRMELLPNMRFVPPHTYTLYKGVASEEKFRPIIDSIFNGLKTTQQKLEYFENFPARPVEVEMKGGELREIYQRCRIFHFTLEFQQFSWFEWEQYYNLFMFDPLLQPHHIQEIADRVKPSFNQKLFPRSKQDKFNHQRINFVLAMLKGRDQKVRLFLPSLVELLERQPEVQWQPFIDIYVEDMRQLCSGPHVQIIKNVECLYYIVLGCLSEKSAADENVNTFLGRYFEFVFYADEHKMNSISMELVDRAKEIRDAPQFNLVLESLKGCVAKRVLSIIKAAVNIQERKEKNLRNKTTAALSLFRVLNRFLAAVHQQTLVGEIVEQLFMPIYLQYALFRIEIWQLLHVFLEELAEEELKRIVRSILAKNNNTCLRLLSSVPYLYPLQNHLDLKRYYVQLCSALVKPMILDELEAQNSGVLSLLRSLADHSVEESLIYSVGLRGIVKQLVLECGDNEILETIFQVCIKETISRLFTEEDTNKTMRISITLKNILPEFGELLSDKMGEDTFQQCLQTIRQVLQEKKLAEELWRVRLEAAVDIVAIYWSQDINTQLVFEDKAFPLSSLIVDLMEAMTDKFININYEMQVLLNFANAVIEKKTLEPFSDQLVKLENMVMKLMNFNFKTASQHTEETKFSSDSLVKLCQFLRKVLPVIEAFRTEFRPLVVQNILDLCNAKVEDYKVAADDVGAGVVDENVDTVVLEFSELITRFSLVVSQDLDEELAVSLLGCVFPQIQKSAFILVRQYYELGYAKGAPPPAYMARLESKVDPEATTLVFSQILMWSAFFLRKLCTDKNRKEDSEEEEDSFESSKLSDVYLSFLFSTIEQLDFEETLPSFSLQPQQVWEVSPDWSNFLTKQEVLRLAIQSLFIFADSFPMSLRLWVSGLKDKSTKLLCEKVIRELVSQALFLKEVEKIELRQPEWKSQNFEVYAARRSREISAEYKKENASVSLKLKVRPDYPLSTIVIEFANELKIEQQLNKWAVRLRSILYNQNNSIASAILLWKQNIDKEFEGIEECAICYDIVNAVKQLPRMVCKTCRKKFHAACIRKWFTTSNKSECPLCKSQFL